MGIADFLIKLGFDTKQVSTGTDKAKADIQKLAQGIDTTFGKLGAFKDTVLNNFKSAAGAAVIGKIFDSIEHRLEELIEKAKEIRIGSIRTELDPGTYQRTSNVLESKGSSIETFEKTTEKVADAIQTIRDGKDDGAKLQTAFARLGVTMDDIAKKNHAQIWFEIAENMKSVEMTTQRLAAMRDIFGAKGSVGALMPAFKEGFDGRLANRGILDDAQLEQLKKLKESDRSFSQPWEDMLNEGATNNVFSGVRKIWKKFRHPFKSFGSDAFDTARQFGYLDDKSEFSDPGQEARMAEMSEKLTKASEKKAEAAAKIAADKKEKAKVDALKKKNSEKLEDMYVSVLPKKLQIEELMQQRTRAAALVGKAGSAEEKAKAQGDLLEIEGKLISARKGGVNVSSAGARSGDSLSSIGLYRGGVQTVFEQIQRQQFITMQQQLSELKSTVRELQSLRRDINAP